MDPGDRIGNVNEREVFLRRRSFFLIGTLSAFVGLSLTIQNNLVLLFVAFDWDNAMIFERLSEPGMREQISISAG